MSLPSYHSNENTSLLVNSLQAQQQQANHDATRITNEATDSNNNNSNSLNPTNSNNSLGAVRVAVGAALFAGTNGAATALYRRNGSTVVSLYILRSPIIYFANALIVLISNICNMNNSNTKTTESGDNDNASGSAYASDSHDKKTTTTMTAADILLLRTGSRTASKLALLRSLLNAVKAVLLSIGFVFMTYSDAFVIFKGIAVCGTLFVARKLLGTKEALSISELMCGIGVIVGIIMIAPPSALSSLFLDDAKHLNSTTAEFSSPQSDDENKITDTDFQTIGVWIVMISGLMSSVSGTLVRMLSETGGKFDGKAPPSMLLSYLMVVMFIVNGTVACLFSTGYIQKFINVKQQDEWSWTKFIWPKDYIDYWLIGLNCFCTLGGHLATASGYSTTRAGVVAFLQLTEIPWVYLIDVIVLNEETSKLKTIGSTIVFISAVLVALFRK